MPYPNTIKEFSEELFEDATSSDRNLVNRMSALLESFRMTERQGLGSLQEVLGLKGEVGLWETDYIEAAFRTLLLDLFPGPKYHRT